MNVDFYLLKDPSTKARLTIACRLLEKAYQRGHKVFVHTENEQDTHALDDLLWTYREDSFIPHNLQGEGPFPPPPVQIGHQGTPKGFNDILINLSRSVPEFYTGFKRVMEVVCQDETWKQVSREHYKLYRGQGCQLQTHDI